MYIKFEIHIYAPPPFLIYSFSPSLICYKEGERTPVGCFLTAAVTIGRGQLHRRGGGCEFQINYTPLAANLLKMIRSQNFQCKKDRWSQGYRSRGCAISAENGYFFFNWYDLKNSNAKRTDGPRAFKVGGAQLRLRPTAAAAAEKNRPFI